MMEQTELYYDHYKDSFAEIKSYINKRGKLTLLLFLMIAILSFLAVDSQHCCTLLNQCLKENVGIDGCHYEVISMSLVLSFLAIVASYYQICLTIERSYKYLHNVENTLSEMTKLNIDRESKNYLQNYPILSLLVHCFFTYFIPIIVVLVTVLKGIGDWKDFRGALLVIDESLLLLIIGLSIVYVIDRIRLK